MKSTLLQRFLDLGFQLPQKNIQKTKVTAQAFSCVE